MSAINCGLLEFRPHPTKGISAFTKESKPAEETLMTSSSLVKISEKEIAQYSKDPRFQHLSEKSLLGVIVSIVATPKNFSEILLLHFQEFDAVDADIASIPAEDLKYSHREIQIAALVFYSNAYGSGDYRILHSEMSRLNHSCFPNCANYDGRVETYRPVSVGEEACVSYFGQGLQMRDVRRRYLKDHYGFDCDCVVCNNPVSQTWFEGSNHGVMCLNKDCASHPLSLLRKKIESRGWPTIEEGWEFARWVRRACSGNEKLDDHLNSENAADEETVDDRSLWFSSAPFIAPLSPFDPLSKKSKEEQKVALKCYRCGNTPSDETQLEMLCWQPGVAEALERLVKENPDYLRVGNEESKIGPVCIYLSKCLVPLLEGGVKKNEKIVMSTLRNLMSKGLILSSAMLQSMWDCAVGMGNMSDLIASFKFGSDLMWCSDTEAFKIEQAMEIGRHSWNRASLSGGFDVRGEMILEAKEKGGASDWMLDCSVQELFMA
eukprot:GDKJ01018477.1.p1 GENE.GDKJ01018477.1~~GDKJ01018477.1.p1  ORF type:complete len:491 (-),score=102.51 GDKJ01018477.1:317-1789(-)